MKKLFAAPAVFISLFLTNTSLAGVSLDRVDLDILQKIEFGGYIDRERATELATVVAREILNEAGVLDPESEQKVTLYVGYYRRFTGDETPFPVNNLIFPEVSSGFIIQEDGIVTTGRHRSGEKLDMTGVRGMFQKDASGKKGKNFQRDLKGITSASALAAKALVKHLYNDKKRYKAFAKSKHPQALAAANAFYHQLNDDATPEFASISDSPNYIPADVVTDFQSRVASVDQSVRLAAYKELVLNPVNNKALLDKISLNLQTGALTGASAETQAWAAKALGASGFAEYRQPLEEMSNDALSNKVKKHAKRALTSIDNNPVYALTLHDISARQPGQSWKSLQLVNQINSGRLRIQTAAAKQVFREGKDADSFVKAALAQQLRYSSMRHSVRADKSSEFHAWAMKALAASQDRQYLELLELVAKHGLTKKTRKYAKASKKALRKS